MLVYVDDILIACNDKQHAQQFKIQLSHVVKIKDLQSCTHILGITVRRDNMGIYLSQTPVIQQLLIDHGLQQCRPVSVPMSPSYMQEHEWSGGDTMATGSNDNLPGASVQPCYTGLQSSNAPPSAQQFSTSSGTASPAVHQLIAPAAAARQSPNTPLTDKSSGGQMSPISATDSTSKCVTQFNLCHKEQSTYQSILGVLLYISTCTRPDISFSVSVLCRKMQQATQEDMKALKHLLKYLQGTKTEELALGTEHKGLTRYSDASFADCKLTRRSSAGYLFTYMGGTISWKSNLLKTVALSTAESEYMALAAAAQEGLHLR